MNLKEVARNYISKGLSVIPVDNKKCPTLPTWYEYQKRYMTDEEIDKYFDKAWGIAILCGEISGGGDGYSLMVVDIDTKNFDDSISYKEICEAIPKEVFDKLLIAETMNKGYHWYLRVPLTGRNQKFSMRPTTEEERKENPKELVVVTTESRFSGGYVLASPTNGYNIISEVKKIPVLELDEYYCIVDALGSFNRVIDESELFEQFQEEKKNKFLSSPFDDFNKRGSVMEILSKNGYSIVKNVGEKTWVKRSGNSLSSHSGYVIDNRYVNFSTSTQFDSAKSYSASELFTLLECGGNWSESYKRLVEQGYGHNVNMGVKVREFVKAYREGKLMKLLELHFEAKKTKDGVLINNKLFKIEL